MDINMGFPLWSTDALPYGQDETVYLNDKIYLSLENSNSDAPGGSSKWQSFNTFNDYFKYVWSKFRGISP